MKIGQQLRSAAIGILVVGSSSLVSVYLNSQGNDSKVVNYTGIVRGGTQRLVKLELAGKPSDSLIEKQDKLVDGLINGNPQMGLPPASDPEFRSQMQEVATAWRSLKQKIEGVRKNNNMREDLLAASESYFDLADRAVSAAEKYTRAKTERLALIQLVVFASSLLMLIGIWITIDKITKILRTSTLNIATSYDRISTVVNEQEQCVTQQSLSAGKATELINGIKDLTHQSIATIQLSVDRFPNIATSLSKTHQDNDRLLTSDTDLQEKLKSIVAHLDLLDRQVIKFAKLATPEQTLVTTGTRTDRSSQPKNRSIVDSAMPTLGERSANSTEEVNKLFDNLQSSIAAMKTVANDSLQISDDRVKSAKEIALSLRQSLSTIDALSLNNQQMLMTSKQYANVVQQVTSLIDVVSLGARDTTNSIAQIRSSASELGETTAALRSQI